MNPDPMSGASPTPSPEVIREFNDRVTLWLLEDPASLRDLLRILEPDLAERLDFARAARVNRSFIPADLQKQESDLVFRVPAGAGTGEVWVYLLVEHQSRPDPLMPLRLHGYMGDLPQAGSRRH
jgi:predicted transposase YdaD